MVSIKIEGNNHLSDIFIQNIGILLNHVCYICRIHWISLKIFLEFGVEILMEFFKNKLEISKIFKIIVEKKIKTKLQTISYLN